MAAQPRNNPPQVIPRPDRWEIGGSAPWTELSVAERSVSLDTVLRRVAARGAGAYRQSSYRGQPTRQSAVLVPVYAGDGDGDGPTLILTRRAAHMRSHRHEVSFPGGRQDDEDASLQHTALREAQEEIALCSDTVSIVGELDRFVTGGSKSLVHPFVGHIAPPVDLVANPDEVELIRHVPLADLLADDVWREEHWTRDGHTITITFFELDGDTVWGATAVMLRQLLSVALGIEGNQNRQEWG